MITYLLDSSSWIHGAMHVEKRVVIIETATLHAGTCTSRVITYLLDSSSWIHGAMHVEERVECVNTKVTSQRLKIKPIICSLYCSKDAVLIYSTPDRATSNDSI